MRLADFDVLTFDCYGTLIDWETGMTAALAPITSRSPVALSRNAILEAHARAEAMQQVATPTMPYRDLLAVVAKRLAEEWGVAASWEECTTYGRSIGSWPAFADTVASLAYLKRHFKLVILSNVDNESFAASNRRLGVDFDAVYTAQDIGSYKPALGNFSYMLDRLAQRGVRQGKILHVAESLFHDHAPAKAIGLATCWIHRRHGEEGSGATMPLAEVPKVDARFTSLADLAQAHRNEIEPPA